MSGNPSTLIIRKGEDFLATLTWYTNTAKTTTQDLTGYTAKMQIRKNHATDPIVTLTTGGGGITIESPETGGVTTLAITDTVTATLTAGDYIYDILYIKTGENRIPVKGVVTVERSATIA